jgi:hypothetical protein
MALAFSQPTAAEYRMGCILQGNALNLFMVYIEVLGLFRFILVA